MADNKEAQPTTPAPTPTTAATTEQPKKTLTLEIDEVDTSELLERKISA